ncbi:MAG TPA: hypothetical protein VMZ53_21140 [Kofleriaceae bacterium]|nr:hypothetical protein [Kofleriaceae bacterium]
MARAALLFLAVAACSGSGRGHKPPSEAECQAYRDKLFAYMPEADRTKVTAMGLGKQTPIELALCQQRMKSDEIACVVASKTFDEALLCKPAVDDRPAEMKRSPAECQAFMEHVTKLANDAAQGDASGPPFTPFMAKLTARECGRWLSKERYECVMQAPTTLGIVGCPP